MPLCCSRSSLAWRSFEIWLGLGRPAAGSGSLDIKTSQKSKPLWCDAVAADNLIPLFRFKKVSCKKAIQNFRPHFCKIRRFCDRSFSINRLSSTFGNISRQCWADRPYDTVCTTVYLLGINWNKIKLWFIFLKMYWTRVSEVSSLMAISD